MQVIIIVPNGVGGSILNPMHGHMRAGRGLGQLLEDSGSSLVHTSLIPCPILLFCGSIPDFGPVAA